MKTKENNFREDFYETDLASTPPKKQATSLTGTASLHSPLQFFSLLPAMALFVFAVLATAVFLSGTPGAEANSPPSAPVLSISTEDSDGHCVRWTPDPVADFYRFRLLSPYHGITSSFDLGWGVAGSSALCPGTYIYNENQQGLPWKVQIQGINDPNDGSWHIGPTSEITWTTPRDEFDCGSGVGIQKAPVKPTTFTATPGANGQVTLSWTMPGSMGSNETPQYWQYHVAGGPGGSNSQYPRSWFGLEKRVSGAGSVRSYTVTDLDLGKYHFRVRGIREVQGCNGVDRTFKGHWSDIKSAAPTSGMTPPDLPTSATAAAGNQSIVLSWTPGGDGGSSIQSWEYMISPSSERVWNTVIVIPDSAPGEANATSFTITGLTNGTSYDILLRARNARGTSSPWYEVRGVIPTSGGGDGNSGPQGQAPQQAPPAAVPPAPAPVVEGQPRFPILQGAVLRQNELTLEYDIDLDPESVPDTDDFDVVIDGEEIEVSEVDVSGRNVKLTLDLSLLVPNVSISVSYIPGTNPIRSAGNEDAEVERFDDYDEVKVEEVEEEVVEEEVVVDAGGGCAMVSVGGENGGAEFGALLPLIIITFCFALRRRLLEGI